MYLSRQSTPAAETVTSGRSYYIGAVLLVVLGVILLAWPMIVEALGVQAMVGVLALLIGAGCAYKGYTLSKAKVVTVFTKDFSNLETRAGRSMPTTESEYETLLSEIENVSEQIRSYGDDVNHFKAYR